MNAMTPPSNMCSAKRELSSSAMFAMANAPMNAPASSQWKSRTGTSQTRMRLVGASSGRVSGSLGSGCMRAPWRPKLRIRHRANAGNRGTGPGSNDASRMETRAIVAPSVRSRSGLVEAARPTPARRPRRSPPHPVTAAPNCRVFIAQTLVAGPHAHATRASAQPPPGSSQGHGGRAWRALSRVRRGHSPWRPRGTARAERSQHANSILVEPTVARQRRLRLAGQVRRGPG